MKYLARLKSETTLLKELPKLSKGDNEAFGSFGSPPNRHILKNELSVTTDPLFGSAAVCQGCPQLEIMEIMGKPVSGCLYTAPGEYPDGWRRLPDSLKKCMWPRLNPRQRVRGNGQMLTGFHVDRARKQKR